MAGNYVRPELVVNAMRRVRWSHPGLARLYAYHEHWDDGFRQLWP